MLAQFKTLDGFECYADVEAVLPVLHRPLAAQMPEKFAARGFKPDDITTAALAASPSVRRYKLIEYSPSLAVYAEVF